MNNGRFLKSFLLFLLIPALTAPFILLKAETPSEEEEILSQTKISPHEERQALEEELKKLEEEIAKYENDIAKTQQEKKTLQNKIYILQTGIKKLELQISQSSTMIKDLKLQVEDTEKSVESTFVKINDSKEKIAHILRVLHEEDQKSLIEVFLVEENLTDFFDNLTALDNLNSKNRELLSNIKKLKLYLEDQKNSLDKEKSDLENVVIIQTLQKQENEGIKKTQDKLLMETRGKESEYQKILSASQKKAQEIRSRIFDLIGIPEAPTFGEALELAKYAESVTGVRPALLLAVLTQESNIGKNVGQCYVTDLKTGDGVNIRAGSAVKKVMKPMGLSGRRGDTDDFFLITSELGKKWNETPVSCPIPSVGGYGGAMGPAQFIPSTWMSYKDKVKEITGKAANPWDIKHAFLAAALYLAKYGAAEKTYNAEWKAAMIYFSGSTNARYRFYGDSVMAIAAGYENDIKDIEKSNGN